jgi:hypothetical protein
MFSHFAISTELSHDGDHVVRYEIAAVSSEFQAKTGAWGSDTRALELAEALSGFPKSRDAVVEYSFGPDCHLRFQTSTGRGHCQLWVSVAAESPPWNSTRCESAVVCIAFLPSAIDAFCNQLRSFKPQQSNCAELVGDAAQQSDGADRDR